MVEAFGKGKCAIKGLSIEQLENLVEALLDFSSVTDLEAWLNQQ